MVARLAPLDRKLLRDLWHLRGQLAAVAVVVTAGVAVVVTTRTSYSSLIASRAAYYEGYRFADVFAHLSRAPESLAPRLAAIPGVETAETRIVVSVTLDVPGLPEPATGRLVSIPADGDPLLNVVRLRRGRQPDRGRQDEVIASEAFADANQLDLGATLGAVINGRWQRLRVVGVGISPEYVYEIGEGQLFPDSRRFGVLWMSRDALGPAFDMVGAFNDVAVRLGSGAVEPEVIGRLDRMLERYGGLGAYGRGEHVSARFLNDEIAQNRVSGTVIPAIFLGIAAFLLNVVLARLVATEREQIAVLKAFGYSDWAVGRHYLKFSLVAVLLGAGAGIVLGLRFASAVNANYAQYYRFPEFAFRPDAVALALALLVTLLAALAGAAGAVRRVVALPPATAMQSEPPARFHPGALERLGLHHLLGAPGRSILRQLERRPLKAVLSTFGIAFAVAMLMLGRFLIDAILVMGDVQFRQVQRENITLVFNGPRSGGVRYEVARLPGVRRAEPYRAVPVRLSAGHRGRRTVILGLDRPSELRRLVGRDLATVPVTTDGLVLTSKLAEILRVRPGDTVTVNVLEGARPTRAVTVAGVVDELLGMSAYMERRALNRVLREGNTQSGAFLSVDPARVEILNERLKRLPGVAAVGNRDAALKSFEDTLAESIGLVTSVLIGFAGALAIAIVYNAARIALSERGRELASLRVLGFSRGEVARMLLGEQAVLTLVGVALGLVIGYGFCAIMSALYQWELFRIPLVVRRATYVFAATVVLAAAAASALLIRRRINRLDLVAVLKTRE